MSILKIKFSKKYYLPLMNGSLRAMVWVMRILPRCIIELFMECIFPLVSLGLFKLKQIGIKNLHILYGNSKTAQEYHRIVNQYIKSIGYSVIDVLYYVKRPKKLMKRTEIQGEEQLRKVLQMNRGAIVVSAHLSNFPLMFVALVQKGYKVNVIIRTMRDADFSKFVYELCARWGINMIQTAPKKEFLKESLGALKRNELLFILLDEFVAQENGIRVNFLNQQVIRATGPILFLERTGAPIIPMFIAQDEKKHFKIFVEQPFQIHEEGSKEENTLHNITGLTQIIEGFVQKYPLQWGGWLNKRWSEE